MKIHINSIASKFQEIAEALNVPVDLIYKIDENGVPFLGFKPSVLYETDASKLENISPIKAPTTFFITGDATDTNNISLINSKFARFENMGIPNSHRIAQSLICRLLIEKPIYKNGKPIIPIGIDNYIFASPEAVVKRFKVLQIYAKTLSKPTPYLKRRQLKKAISYTFSKKEKLRTKLNTTMIKQITRIFPNALKTIFTNEPPSSLTHVGNIISGEIPLAVVQMEYFVHPLYMNMHDNYYIYLSEHPLNKGKSFPKSKGNYLVSILPIMRGLRALKAPQATELKKIIISSGGAAGRIGRMIEELGKIKLDNPLEFLILTGARINSKEYKKLLKMINKNRAAKLKMKLYPKLSLKQWIDLINESSAMISFPGTYSTLGALASGRPFAAVIDTRTTEDRIFTDHVKGNAIFAKKVLNYPAVIIKDSITTKDVRKLIDDDYIHKAFQKATEKGGIRDMFRAAEKKWHDIFYKFI